MKETILITGGAGFIGSNFINFLIEENIDYEIINLDKLTYAANINNPDKAINKDNYHFIKGDISNRELVEYIFLKFKPMYVINFAAESHVDRSIEAPEIFIKSNVYGVYVLLDVAKDFWINNNLLKIAKFIQISTDEVYGSLNIESKEKFKEDSPLMPNSPYSASKASADLIARSYFITYKMPIIITRSSNNYGPRQYHEKLIPTIILNALNGKQIPIYGDGLNIRDWLFVKDNCEAIYKVLQKGEIGEIYNIGGENEWKNLDLVNFICEILGEMTNKNSNIYKKLITFVKDRPGHDRKYSLDITKIKNKIGWTPKKDFKDGLKETIKWYLDRNNFILK